MEAIKINYRGYQRITAALLAVVVLLAVVLSPAVTVYAETKSWDDMPVAIKPEYTVGQAVQEYLTSLICGIYPGNPVDFYNNKKEEYEAWWGDIYDREKKKHGGDSISFGDDIELTEDDMQKFKDITDSNMMALNGYYLITPNISKADALKKGASVSFMSGVEIDNFESCLENAPRSFFLSVTDDHVYLYNLYSDMNYVGYIDGSYTYMLPDSKITSTTSYKQPYSCFLKRANYSVTYNGDFPSNLYSYAFCAFGPMKIFYSYADFRRWALGAQSTVYISNQYINYKPTSTIINASKISQVVKQEVVKNVYNESTTNITEAGGETGLTQNQVQDIVDQAVEKVLAALPTPTPIVTPTPAPTTTPGGGGSGGESGGDSSGLLQKIYDQLLIMSEKVTSGFEDTVKAIKDIKTGCGNGFVGSLLGSAIGGLADDIVDKLLNEKETVKDAAESIVKTFTPLVEASKTKFPTCLPWDLVAVFRVLSAEPETPVFKIPFKVESIGFDYELTLDLKDFDTLSKLTRAFLALSFLVVLMKFTLDLVEGGFFDD